MMSLAVYCNTIKSTDAMYSDMQYINSVMYQLQRFIIVTL